MKPLQIRPKEDLVKMHEALYNFLIEGGYHFVEMGDYIAVGISPYYLGAKPKIATLDKN